MIYPLLRSLLFQLETETSHHLSMTAIDWLYKSKLNNIFYPKPPAKPVEVMGLTFPNRVGLAAGLDKNGDYLAALSALGFGFVEIGTVTPKPQPGNDKPRLFRLQQAEAIINRMGFNNLGVEHLIEQVENANFDAKVGINIGKNIFTSVEQAHEDYLIGLEKVYPHADYVAVNISSPNTPGLRKLQFGEALASLISRLKEKQLQLQQQYGRYVPMAVKVAPDLSLEEVQALAETFTQLQVDAVITTNTTMDRDKISGHPHAEEAGGLSGRPLLELSTTILSQFRQALPKTMPIIAVGGIIDVHHAQQKIDAGADLIQIYTGFIYRGPGLIRTLVKALP